VANAGVLIGKQSHWWLAGGYGIAAALMLVAALIEARSGIDSALEQIAKVVKSDCSLADQMRIKCAAVGPEH
jgi:hypothetical protein